MANITFPIHVDLPDDWIDQIIDRLRDDPDADWAKIIHCPDCKWYDDGHACHDCRWAHPDCFERRTDDALEYKCNSSTALAKNIKSAMAKKGLSQRELARRINVKEVTLSRYITGNRTPKATTLNIIAKELGVTMDSLMERRTDESD